MAQIYVHPVSGSTVIPVLEQLLPYPLPLLNRIKFHHRSAGSQILASFPVPDAIAAGNVLENRPILEHKCFAIAFLDRTRRPETEIWIFSSGEVPGRCSLSSSQARCGGCQTSLLSLVETIKHSEVPESVHDPAIFKDANPAMKRAYSGEVILIGTLHHLCEAIIRQASPKSIVPPPITGIDEPYMKYLFRASAMKGAEELPDGLRWGAVRVQDFDLVRSRTSIPRQNATLALLPSLAIFPDNSSHGEPIAWAFLGVDGSLTSLHTEPEYRGRGLAKRLASKLFNEGGHEPVKVKPPFASTGRAPSGKADTWYCADVGLNNESSKAVSRGLGGTEGWKVYWLRIDVTKT